MNIIAYFVIGLVTVEVLNGYVLLQVRKGENQSNVDALIHKVVPTNKFEKIAETARKHFRNYKQYKVKTQANDKDLESIVFAIKTDDGKSGNKRNKYSRRESEKVGDVWIDIKKMLMNFVNPEATQPSFKSKMDKYNIKPEKVQSRNGKPSMIYEIETSAVLKSLTDTLNSQKARRYSDKLAKTVAYAYRMINDA